MLNFQGTVYIRNGIAYSLPLIGGSIFLVNPGSILIINQHTYLFLKTQFARFLILMSLSAVNLSKLVFSFVPLLDFSKKWTDEDLYKKYGLSDSEIGFINSIVKPLEW